MEKRSGDERDGNGKMMLWELSCLTNSDRKNNSDDGGERNGEMVTAPWRDNSSIG